MPRVDEKMSEMLVKCSNCGKGWIDDFSENTKHCPNCGNSTAEVLR
jgi:ribosomal protein S27AE